MTTRNRVQYSLIIASGLTIAFLTSILYVELRWSLNLFALVLPWLAVSGLMLALAVRPRQKRWPFIPAIAFVLCCIQLYVSQTFWTNLDVVRKQNTQFTTVDLTTFYIRGIEGNNPDGYEESEGGMKALPSLGKKGYAPFLTNLGLWVLSVLGTCVVAHIHNTNVCKRGIESPPPGVDRIIL